MQGRRSRTEISRLQPVWLALLGGGVLLVGPAFSYLAVAQLEATAERIDDAIGAHAESAIGTERLSHLSEQIGRTTRSYLLTGDERFLDEAARARDAFAVLLDRITHIDAARSGALLMEVRRLEAEHEAASAHAVASYRNGAKRAAVAALLERDVQPVRDELEAALDGLAARETAALAEARRAARDAADRAAHLLVMTAVVCGLFVCLAILTLGRALARLHRSRSELDEALQAIELRNRDLDAFAGRIAHDLKNIFAPLPLIADGLARGGVRPEQQAAIAERLQRTSARAAGMMDALLSFSRVGSAPDPDATARADEIVTEVLDSLASQRAKAAAEVEVDVSAFRVACSPGLLHVVLLNVVGNAFKYLEGSAVRRVRIEAAAQDGSAEITVADTGPGMLNVNYKHPTTSITSPQSPPE